MITRITKYPKMIYSTLPDVTGSGWIKKEWMDDGGCKFNNLAHCGGIKDSCYPGYLTKDETMVAENPNGGDE